MSKQVQRLQEEVNLLGDQVVKILTVLHSHQELLEKVVLPAVQSRSAPKSNLILPTGP